MPKISVIMPVYNTIRFLPEAIDSILNQTFADFEFIILDDFSIDGSYELLLEYEKKDKRICVFRNDSNKGISYTRNKLIDLTNTNYIATQDSDDVSLIDRLEKEFSFLESNLDFSAISGNNIIINEKSEDIGYRKYSINIKDVILKKSPISNPASMFRKDIFLKLGGYEKGLNYGEDYDLWLKMYLNGYKLKVIDDYVIKLRIRDGQTKSSKLKETLKNTIYLQKKYIKLGIKPSFSDKLYVLLEKILVILPGLWIMSLFKLIEYRKGK